MRVVMVHTDFRLYWPPRLRAFQNAMACIGGEVHIWEVAGAGTPYTFASTNVSEELWKVLIPQGDLREMSGSRMARTVEKNLNSLCPDIVMAGGIAYPSGAAAVRWARRNNRPVIVFDNVRPQDVPRSWAVEWVKRQIYRNVDAMLIPAESHIQGFSEWGVQRDRLFFGLNVVDNDHFSMRAERARKSEARIRSEIDLPDRFFLGVGRHIAQKNWKTCIDAYANYRAQCAQNPWGMVLVGDGPEQENLKKHVVASGVEGIQFPGVVVGDDLCDLYGLANALVLPSLGETWGLVVNEAMASRLPVLVSNECGCCQTLVREGENGWSFSPNDVESLMNLMMDFSSMSDSRRLDMGRCSAGIVSKWGLDRFVQGAMEAIEAVSGVRRGFTGALEHLVISLWNGRFRPV